MSRTRAAQPRTQPVPRTDPNYAEIAYSHYRIRWSQTHWSLYKVSDGRWIRLDAQRLDTHPVTMRQIVRMADLHMSGHDPAHLYATITASKPAKRVQLQSVPTHQSQVVTTPERLPTRAERREAAREARENPAPTRAELREAADEAAREADTQGERAILRAKLAEDRARKVARAPRGKRAAVTAAAAPLAAQPLAAVDTTVATLQALQATLALASQLASKLH